MNKHRIVPVLASVGAAGLLALAAASGCGDGESRCDESGHACTWLGLPGEEGYNGDGHDRRATMLYWTMDMQFGRDGTVWFIDWNNHLVRKVTPEGKVFSVLGWNDPVFPGDGNSANPGAELTPAGAPGLLVQLNHPTDLTELADGSILVMAWHNHKLRRIDPATGSSRILSGAGAGFVGDGGPATAALYRQPVRLTLDGQQNIYIIDQQNQRIRKIDAQTNMISTVAGSGVQGFAGDNGPALAAQVSFKIGDNPEPSSGIVYHAGALYFSDTENNRIRKVDLQSGIITTIAGTGQQGYSGDNGPATDAKLYHPRDLEIGPQGDLYIADTDNGRIRAIDLTSGTIRTVAGAGELGLDANEDISALKVRLNRPFGIDFDPAGNLYICDTLNSRILRVAR